MGVRSEERFELRERLGEGAMGQVWRAGDRATGREVALKLMAEGLRGSPEAQLAFRAEFLALVRLAGRGVVAVHDFGAFADGRLWLAQEWLPGPGLDERLGAEPAEARAWLIDALVALAGIHARGMLHGDMKPANMRFTADGRLKLLDFGLALPIGSAPGALRGTPLYMAPEAARGERLDARSELYALGAVFYHVLAGRPPFAAEGGATELMKAHLYAAPQALAELVPGVPGELALLLARLLAKSPLDRPASAAEALAALGWDEPTLWPVGFVGREALLDELLAATGQQGASELTGPPGIGKSSVLAALAQQARAAGRQVLAADAADADGTPGGALAAARLSLLALARAAAPEAAAAHGAALAGDAGELDPRSAHARTLAAWAALVAAVAGDRPVLLLLDAWDRADEASRELVASLLARPELPLAVVSAGAPAAAGAARREVGALTPGEAGRFAAVALGTSEVGAAFAEALHGLTAGAPALLAPALDELVRRGGLRREGGRWRVDTADFTGVALPTDVTALAARRLEGLAAPARALAEGLALLRRPRPATELAGWLGLPPHDVASALAALGARELVRQDGAGARLADAAVAARLHEELPAERARALHAAIAANVPSPAEQAHHWAAAGEPDRAVAPALAGARELLEGYALADAAALAELVAAAAGADDGARAEARELLGDVARLRGRTEAAAEHYEAALALRGDSGGTARARASLAIALQVLGRLEAAIAAAARAAEAAEAEGRLAECARALTTLARLHHQRGELEAARDAAERALAVARDGVAPAFEAEALGLLGFLESAEPTTADAGLARLAEAIALRERIGDPVGLNDAYNLLGNALLALGRYREARAAFERNRALGRALAAVPEDLATAAINLALVGLELGDFAMAIAASEEAIATFREIGSRFLEGYALALRGRLSAALGRLAAALADTSAALAVAREIDSAYLLAVCSAYRGEVELAIGDPLGALERARDGLAAGGDPEHAAALELVAARAYMALGDMARAEARLAAARGQAGANAALTARAALLAAELAMARGQDAAAEAALTAARDAAQAGGLAALVAQAGEADGRRLAAAGRHAEAARRFREAHGQAEALGLALVSAAAALGLAGSEPGEAAGPLVARAEAELTRMAGELDAGDAERFRARWRRTPAAGLPDAVGDLTIREALARLAEAPRAGRADHVAEAVAEFGQLVTGTLGYEEALDRVLERVLALTGAERGIIFLVGADGGLTGLATWPAARRLDADLLGFSRSFVDAALRERRSIWSADAQADEGFAAAASVMALDLRTVICVPLIVDQEVIGLLYLDQRTVNRAFTADDLRLVEGLAGFAGLAIANARRYEEAQERRAVLEAGRALNKLASPRLDRPSLERAVVEIVLALSGADACTLLVGEPLRPAASAGRGGATPGAPDAALVERARATARASLAGRPDEAGAEAWRSALALPLLAEQRLVGVLYFEAGPDVRPFTPRDAALLEEVADQAALALDALAQRELLTARLVRAEQALALLESGAEPPHPLLGPEQLRRRLADEVGAAARHGDGLALVVVAARGLDEVHERFGEATATAVLGQLGEGLAALARHTDVVARLSANCFALLLPRTDAEAAGVLVRRIAAYVPEVVVCAEDDQVLWSLRASTAVDVWRAPEPGEDWLARVLARAESAPD